MEHAMSSTPFLPTLVPSTEPVRLLSPDAERVRIDLDAYCWTCEHRHRLGRTPQTFTQELWEWEAKHRGHAYEFLSPARRIPPHFDDQIYEIAGEAPWWLALKENANVKISYASAVALTITLASLATSSTFLVGQASTALDNTSNLYIDGRFTAIVTTGTTPVVDTEIRLYGYADLTDTPTYPDGITGTNAGKTITNAYILDSGLILLGATAVSATSNITYPIRCLTVAEAFGLHPKRVGIFAVHNTNVNLHATPANHAIQYSGAFITSV
jgi:hypothetical protein